MRIQFPVFLCDRDGYVYSMSSLFQINQELESNDIEYREYVGWDVEGREVELFLEGNQIEIKAVSEEKHRDDLIKSLKKYATIIRPKEEFNFGKNENPIEIYKVIEDYINANSFLGRLKNKFKKLRS